MLKYFFFYFLQDFIESFFVKTGILISSDNSGFSVSAYIVLLACRYFAVSWPSLL